MDRARALVAADSVSARGNFAAAAVLEPLYAEAGLRVVRQEFRESIDGAPVADHVNLLAGPGGDGPWSAPEAQARLAAGEVPESARGGVLLVTHTDTVPTGPRERWTETGGNPHALTEKDGVLFGLGVADVKLDALCKIAAAMRLRGRRLTRPFWLCGTAAEEVGLRGARRLAQSPLFASLGVRQVLCGEPTELELYDAHKGYAVVRCTLIERKASLVPADGPAPGSGPAPAAQLDFFGKAAHSSTPHLGVNAIDRALAWAEASRAPILAVRGGASANTVPALCSLRVPAPPPAATPAPDQVRLGEPVAPAPDLSRALRAAGALCGLWLSLLGRLEPRADARVDPPGAVGGFNVVTGGEDPASPAAEGASQGRGRVEATFDARLLPQHDPEALFALFEAAARAWVEKLGAGELLLEISIERSASGMSLPEGSPLVTALSATLARLGLDPKPRKKPTSTEAGVFSRAGCEAVVLGPGRSTGNAHTANERILVSQLERAIELYTAILVDLCGARPA